MPLWVFPERRRSGRAEEPRSWPRIVLYSGNWCPQGWWTKLFLNRHDAPYHELDIDRDPEAALKVMAINDGFRSVPTLVIEGCGTVTEPSNGELARILEVD